jgi:hypothetical protein
MASRATEALDIPASTAQGAAQTVGEWSSFTLFVTGTFVASIQLQISADGTNWADEGAAITAPGNVQITKECMFIRANVTHTSGTPAGLIVGQIPGY